jgi:hypothetical protein
MIGCRVRMLLHCSSGASHKSYTLEQISNIGEEPTVWPPSFLPPVAVAVCPALAVLEDCFSFVIGLEKEATSVA